MGISKQLAEYSTHLENMAFLKTRINESLNVKLIFNRGYDKRDNNITRISVLKLGMYHYYYCYYYYYYVAISQWLPLLPGSDTRP